MSSCRAVVCCISLLLLCVPITKMAQAKLLKMQASGVLSGKYSKDHIPEGSRLADEQYKVSC